MKSKKVWISVVVLLAIAAGLYAWLPEDKTNLLTTENPKNSSDAGGGSANPDSTSESGNWRVFKNDQLEFKYPSSYTVSETNGTISVEDELSPAVFINKKSSGLPEEAQVVKDEVRSFAAAKLLAEKSGTLDGRPYIQLVVYYPQRGTEESVYTFIEVGEQVYVVSSALIDTASYNQIVSSLKFSDN